MKISLPPQLSAISRYATIVLPVTEPERSEGTTDKIRVIRTGDMPAEMTLTMKKVPSQRATLQVRSLNGAPFRGMARIAGLREPDLIARGGLILQTLVNASRRPHSIPLDRYCSVPQLETQRGLLEEEARALTDLGMSAEGQALFRRLCMLTERLGVGILLRRDTPLLAEGGPQAVRADQAPNPDFWSVFRANLRTLVEGSPLTQTAIDRAAGLYNGHISHLKCGTSNKLPAPDQLVALAKIFNVLPSDLHPSFADLDASAIEDSPTQGLPDSGLTVPPTPDETGKEVFAEPDVPSGPDQGAVSVPAPQTGPETGPDPEPVTVRAAEGGVGAAPSVTERPRGVSMVSTGAPARVRIIVDADVDYLVGRHIMDLIHGGLAGVSPAPHPGAA